MGNGINASRRSPLLIALLDFIFGENESLKSLRGVLWLFEDLEVSSTRILGGLCQIHQARFSEVL